MHYFNLYQRTPPVRGFRLDVEETSGEYRIHAELPGVEKKNVDIRVEDDLLTVRAEFSRANNGEEKTSNPLWRERQCGQVARSFRLPPDVNVETIGAEMKNGVLSLSLPKAPERETARRIAVK